MSAEAKRRKAVQLNIGPRLMLGLAVIIFSMLAADAIVLWQFHLVRAQAGRLSSIDQKLIAVLRLHTSLTTFHDRLEELADSQDIGQLVTEGGRLRTAVLVESRRAISAFSLAPSDLQRDPTILPILHSVESALPAQLDAITTLANDGDWRAVHERLANQATALQSVTLALVDRVDQEVGEEQAQTQSKIKRLQRLVFLMVPLTAAFTLLIAATFGLAVTRSITQPLARLVAGSKALAAGDFQHEVFITGRDELADLGRVFNDTARRLQDLYATLQQSEERLRLVIDTIPANIWSTSPDGAIDFVNQRWQELTGSPREHALGWNWEAVVHPDDRTRFAAHWRAALSNEQPMETEVRVRQSDRNYRWLFVRNVPLHDKVGKVVKWYGTSFDIDDDDRKRAEEALRESERRFRLIFDGIDGLVAIMTSEGQLELVNNQLLEYFGKTVEELKGWPTGDSIHPDDLPNVLASWRHSVETGNPYDNDYRLRRADGAYRWFHARGLSLRDAESRILRWYMLLTDIDGRKKAEERLRHSEELLAQSQRLSLTGSFLWRASTDEITWSEQLYRIFEFDQGVPVTLELIGSRIHPEDLAAFRERIEQSRRDGGDVQLDFRLQLPDQSVKYVHIVARSSRDEKGRLEYIGAVQDVTQRRLSEEALSKARSELAHVARFSSLGAMTASIAHEVNQPLAGIVTNASTCLRMLATDPPNVDGARETARRAIRDGNRASDVIKRLRALFSKKDAATEPVDLNEATREVIALSLSELQRNRVILRLDLAEDLPYVTGDRVQLQQVILNLLRNASDAMSTIDNRRRELLIRSERDGGDHVRLAVQDVGIGFDPETADKLFESFYTTKNEGMGIGLSISRSIIEKHHGRLWATPNEGPGATFSFSIPCSLRNLLDAKTGVHGFNPTTGAA